MMSASLIDCVVTKLGEVWIGGNIYATPELKDHVGKIVTAAVQRPLPEEIHILGEGLIWLCKAALISTWTSSGRMDIASPGGNHE